MENTSISFNKIEILEWYDGVVRAIGEVETKIYLIVLVAWDMSKSVKLYALIELSEIAKDEMMRELNSARSKEENWRAFNSMFDRYIRHYDGEAHLILGEIKENKPYELKTIDPNHIKKLINYEFEDTMSETSVNYWFKTLQAG